MPKIATERETVFGLVDSSIKNRSETNQVSNLEHASVEKAVVLAGSRSVVDVTASTVITNVTAYKYLGKLIKLENGVTLGVDAGLDDLTFDVFAKGADAALDLPGASPLTIEVSKGIYQVYNDGDDNYSVKNAGEAVAVNVDPLEKSTSFTINSTNRDTYQGQIIHMINTTPVTVTIDQSAHAKQHFGLDIDLASGTVELAGTGGITINGSGTFVEKNTYIKRRGDVIYYTAGSVESNVAPEATVSIIQGDGTVGTTHIGYYEYSDGDTPQDQEDTAATEKQWQQSATGVDANNDAVNIVGATSENYVPNTDGVYIRYGVRPHALTGTLVGEWSYTTWVEVKEAGSGVATILGGSQHTETWDMGNYSNGSVAGTALNSLTAVGSPTKIGSWLEFDAATQDGLYRDYPALDSFGIVELMEVIDITDTPHANSCYNGFSRGGTTDFAAMAAMDNGQPRAYTRTGAFNFTDGADITSALAVYMRYIELIPGVGLSVKMAKISNQSWSPITVVEPDVPNQLTQWNIGYEHRPDANGGGTYGPSRLRQVSLVATGITSAKLNEIFQYYKTIA